MRIQVNGEAREVADGATVAALLAELGLRTEQVAVERNRELVRRAIDQLPQPSRAILVLRDIEGYSTAETATMLRITEGAAKVRLHRARTALKGLLCEVFRRDDRE